MNRPIELRNPSGLDVLIMGLGINGGGLESARYFASRGANVTVTDLRNEDQLKSSLDALKAFPIKKILGEHRIEDFEKADLVVKNPGVPASSPFLKASKRVTTDIEIFLSRCSNPLYCVTGSKGKSTTVSALSQVLKSEFPMTLLGGNITISPLSFLDKLDGVSPVVLELSSWQLRDLNEDVNLKCRVAGITNLYHDHMNSYSRMEDYAMDKTRIFKGQDLDSWSLVNLDNPWGLFFAAKTQARHAILTLKGRRPHPRAEAFSYYDKGTGYLEWKGRREIIVPKERESFGIANDYALLFAGTMAALGGMKSSAIRQPLANFSGIEHRMERCHQYQGVAFYNDSAATIPEASVMSLSAFSGRVHWITGGTDKNLDLSPLESLTIPPATLVLLEGSASKRMIQVFEKKHWSFLGPFPGMRPALASLHGMLKEGDTVLMSPGAASFELFQNEFDRGRQFKELSKEIFC